MDRINVTFTAGAGGFYRVEGFLSSSADVEQPTSAGSFTPSPTPTPTPTPTSTSSGTSTPTPSPTSTPTLTPTPTPIPSTTSGSVFVDSGTSELKSVHSSGNVVTYSAAQATAIGPLTRDIDGDGVLEVPYVDGSNNLVIVDANGESTTLDSSGSVDSKRMGVGDFDDDGTLEVVYVRSGELYQVEAGGSPWPVLDSGWNAIAAGSVAGVADFDGDGSQEVVFVEPTNNELQYIDQGFETPQSTGITVPTANALSTPADYDGDGAAEVAYVDGNSNVAFVESSGADGTFDPSYDVTSAPMGAFDWSGDGTPDLVHLDTNQEVRYYDAVNGATGFVTDSGGSHISAATGPGVV